MTRSTSAGNTGTAQAPKAFKTKHTVQDYSNTHRQLDKVSVLMRLIQVDAILILVLTSLSIRAGYRQGFPQSFRL